MNFKKSLFCIFLSVFLISPSLGQNKTPKFTWSNLQSVYDSFDNLNPIIELQDSEYVLIATPPHYNLLMRFDEKQKIWVAGFDIVTDNIGAAWNIVFEKNKPRETFFFWEQFFTNGDSEKSFFIAHNKKQYPSNGRYKIRIYYGTEIDKFDKYTDSPEFRLNINKNKSNK